MTIPREGRLVRLYVQFGETAEGETFDRASVTPRTILDRARPILEPYSLDFRICDWQSVYTIGQRVAPRFSHRNRYLDLSQQYIMLSRLTGEGSFLLVMLYTLTLPLWVKAW